MKWLTALELQRWAETINARQEFPEMIGDLIRASVDDIGRFRFPSGDKSQVRGFDGVLSTQQGSTFVPEGDSSWEFGVNKGALSKWTSDYDKRTAGTAPELRARTTFVFVSPWTWDVPGTDLSVLVEIQRAKGEWKDVRCIDGSQLETWLADCPAVSANYARRVLNTVPAKGAISAEQLWEEYAKRFSPALVEGVVTCGREKQLEELRRLLAGGPSTTTLVADSSDEALAFAVACVRTAGDELRSFLESRLLVVSDEDAARSLLGRKDLVLLLTGNASQLAGVLGTYLPVVVGVGRDIRGKNYTVLDRPSTDSLARALQLTGLEEDRARLLAHSSGRSVTILERRMPSGAPKNPAWLDHAELVLPASIAGGWDSAFAEDRRIVEMLACDDDYQRYEASLCRLLRSPEPVLDRESTIWRMRAPIDAFVQMAHLITSAHLSRFADAFLAVFSVTLPEPEEDEEYRPFEERPQPYSAWLREGLASTLLHISVLNEEAGLNVSPHSPREFVDQLVEKIPGISGDARLLKSLREELPYLAEAAPGPFINALERLLGGGASDVAPLFSEREGFLSPESDLPYILWALELLAWDPANLRRAALVLAGLAAADPGGRLGNRPINSLRTIFVSWCPNTNAGLDERIAVLDEICRKQSVISWDLVEKLLPRQSDTADTNMKPRFRESGLSQRERLTYGHVWRSQDHIVSLAAELAGHDPDRWVALVPVVSDVKSETAQRLVAAMRDFLGAVDIEKQEPVWAAVREEVARVKKLHGDKPVAANLSQIVNDFAPADVVSKHKWLFDDWTPFMDGDAETYDANLHEMRLQAVQQIYEEQGRDGVIRLASSVKLPHFVASAGAALPEVCSDAIPLLTEALSATEGRLDAFAAVFSAEVKSKVGDDFGEALIELVRGPVRGLEDARAASLFFQWPDEPRTWESVSRTGDQIERLYWEKKPSWRLVNPRDTGEVEVAARKYLSANRPLAALEAMEHVGLVIPIPLLKQGLEEGWREINSGAPRSGLLSLALERIFAGLRSREDVDPLDIARWELTWFPLLREPESLTLFRLLGERPELFVELIAAAYKSATKMDLVPTQEQRSVAALAHKVLLKFRVPPGIDQEPMDSGRFLKWAEEVRERAVCADRASIADIHLGMLIAHSAPSRGDDVWPHPAVAEVIELLASSDVERGIYTERFNMRGAVSKSIGEGGRQEGELACTYEEWSKAWRSRPRVAELLLRMAGGWRQHAQREDERARQESLRF